MAKYQEIARILRQRLERGEYPDGKLPPLRKLAASMGVSYLTARQAVQTFKETGGHKAAAPHPFVAVITPLWAFTAWHRAIRNQTRELGGLVRFVSYCSDTDPVIYDTLNQEEYDLIILFPPEGEDARLHELICKDRERIVVMFHDFTQYGVRSLKGADPLCIERFLEILKERGVSRIDAIGRDIDLTSILIENYRVWREWLDRNGMDGQFFSVKHYSFESDEAMAADYCRGILAGKKLSRAVFCLLPEMAVGLYRACHEFGLTPGRDISIFSFGSESKAKLMTPALATVVDIDVPLTVRKMLTEYCPGAKRSDKLIFQPELTDIFLGESLVP